MNREQALRQIGTTKTWDVLVIGGGATGLGTALDAATRGYRSLLLEQDDFAKGASSRSTKLAHGGVRYLQQGNLSLVLEALRERGLMLQNAPHLVHRQSFIIPAEATWQVAFYGIGLKLYDALSGRSSFGSSRILSAANTLAALPGLSVKYLSGGIQYFDGQFDDARMALALALTLEAQGGIALNHARVRKLIERSGRVVGVAAEDCETGEQFEAEAKVVINATGVFSDRLRSLDEPNAPPLLAVSQGTHFVLPRKFLPGADALMIPRTVDGRVLFAIPWHDAVVVGTTDEPVNGPSLEPRALPREREFLLEQIGRYLGRRPGAQEILSVWSGLRPLVRRQGVHSTAALSREHSVLVSPTGLVTVLGGKWTTYRRMGEDTMNIAAQSAGLHAQPSRTANLRLHGWMEPTSVVPAAEALSVYGSDRAQIEQLAQERPELGELLRPRLPYRGSEVVWAARNEMARTVEDVLARRTRALFLDARAAIEAAPRVAALMAAELGHDDHWASEQIANFTALAEGYLYRD
ncbi:MAG: FAD-dependent oxidoreductase [Acidobacteriaceae bacterium]